MFNDKMIVDWKIVMKWNEMIMKKKLLSLLSHLFLGYLLQTLLHNLMDCSGNYSKIQYWIFKLSSNKILTEKILIFINSTVLSEDKSLMWKQCTHLKVKVDISWVKKHFQFEI